METITKTFKIYNADELSKEGQEKAYYKWISEDEYFCETENRITLNKFVNLFNGLTIGNYDYTDCNCISSYFDYPQELDEMDDNRLRTWLYNNIIVYIQEAQTCYKYNPVTKKYNSRKSKVSLQDISDCPLTGYYLDTYILEPILNYMAAPYNTTLINLVNDCLDSWLNACSADYENYFSKENFVEMSNANDWTYLENGELYNV